MRATGATRRTAEPVLSALTSASVVCPSAIGGPDTVGVTTLTEASGEADAGLGADVQPVRLAPARVTEVEAGAGRSSSPLPTTWHRPWSPAARGAPR